MECADQTRTVRQKERRRQKLLRFLTGEAIAILMLLVAISISLAGRSASHSARVLTTVLTVLAAIAVVVIPVIIYGPSTVE